MTNAVTIYKVVDDGGVGQVVGVSPNPEQGEFPLKGFNPLQLPLVAPLEGDQPPFYQGVNETLFYNLETNLPFGDSPVVFYARMPD